MALLDPYTGLWTEEEAAHLARRCGFGARPGERASLAAMGMDAAVDSFLDYPLDDAALDAQIEAFPDNPDTDLGRIKARDISAVDVRGHVDSGAGSGVGVVGRSQDASLLLDVRNDLLAVPHVVPGRDDVASGPEDLFRGGRRQSISSGRVLAVDDHEIR